MLSRQLNSQQSNESDTAFFARMMRQAMIVVHEDRFNESEREKESQRIEKATQKKAQIEKNKRDRLERRNATRREANKAKTATKCQDDEPQENKKTIQKSKKTKKAKVRVHRAPSHNGDDAQDDQPNNENTENNNNNNNNQPSQATPSTNTDNIHNNAECKYNLRNRSKQPSGSSNTPPQPHPPADPEMSFSDIDMNEVDISMEDVGTLRRRILNHRSLYTVIYRQFINFSIQYEYVYTSQYHQLELHMYFS